MSLNIRTHPNFLGCKAPGHLVCLLLKALVAPVAKRHITAIVCRNPVILSLVTNQFFCDAYLVCHAFFRGLTLFGPN